MHSLPWCHLERWICNPGVKPKASFSTKHHNQAEILNIKSKLEEESRGSTDLINISRGSNWPNDTRTPFSKAEPAQSLTEIIYWGNSALLFNAAATETTKQAGYYFTPLQPVKSINGMDKALRILTKLFTGFYSRTLLFPPQLQSARGKAPRRHHVQLLYRYRLLCLYEEAEEDSACKKLYDFPQKNTFNKSKHEKPQHMCFKMVPYL